MKKHTGNMVPLNELYSLGQGLSRPECVVVLRDGELLCSDARGGIARIRTDGQCSFVDSRAGITPNGIIALCDGSFLVANVGAAGGVWMVGAAGGSQPLDIRVDGENVGEVNFVHIDHQGRLWLSVNQTKSSDPIFQPDCDAGSIVVVTESGAKRVASGLGWANELRVSPDGSSLYVSETFGRRLLRYRIGDGETLLERKVVARFNHGDFPDGIALDDKGGVFVVSIISNRVYHCSENGLRLLISDADPLLIEHFEEIFQGRGITRTDLRGVKTGAVLNNISSIAFGGPEMRTAYLGSLGGTNLWCFESPIPGARYRSLPALPSCLLKLKTPQ